MRRFASGNILVFALTDMLGNLARSMVFPYAALYILALGGNAAEIGVVAMFSQLSGLVLLPIAGVITDRSERIRILVGMGLLSSAIPLLNALAQDWHTLALAAFLGGTVVFSFPAYSSLIADSLAVDGRGRGIALMNTISWSLMIIGPYIAGMVIERYGDEQGMRYLYVAMIALYLAGTFLQMRFLKEPDEKQRERLYLKTVLVALERAYLDIPKLVRGMSRPLKALALVIILSFMSQALAGNFWVVYATTHQHLTATQWGLILLVESLAKWALLYPAGALVDRWGRSASLIAALALFTLISPLFILAESFAAVLAVRLLLSVPYVLVIPACTALLADLIPRAARGQTMAALGQGGIMLGASGAPGGPAIGYLVIPPLMLASLAGGFLYDLNPTAPWLLSAGLGLGCVILAAFFIRDPHTAEA